VKSDLRVPDRPDKRAAEGARTLVFGPSDRSKAPAVTPNRHSNSPVSDIARMFERSPARRVVDGLTRLGESVASSVTRLIRSPESATSSQSSSREQTTLFGHPGDVLDTFETHGREGVDAADSSDLDPAASPARSFGLESFDPAAPEPTFPTPPRGPETSKPAAALSRSKVAADRQKVERPAPPRVRSQLEPVLRKASAASRIKRLGVGGLVLIGAAEILVIGWSVLARPSAGPSGSLTVTSNPAGAQLLVDGIVVGTTPETIAVPEGVHAVEVRSNGPTQVAAVRVDSGGQLSRYFDLPVGTAPATLRVETKPAGARVMVDGRVRGQSPIVIPGLNPGPHSVRVERGPQSRERPVMLASGANVTVSVPFEPLPQSTEGHGWLAVSTPVELHAYENGRLIGSSRAGPWQLPAGRHDLEFFNTTLGVQVNKTVEAVAGRIVSMDLPAPLGLVSIASSPAVEIRLDGESIGQSPIANRSLRAGQHDIVASHPTLGERRVSVTVMAGTTLSVNLDLRR
jgi:PEGA domain